MAVSSKDIETLWKRYSSEASKRGVSVTQFFESNGVPYHVFEKWYKKKFTQPAVVNCVVKDTQDVASQPSTENKVEETDSTRALLAYSEGLKNFLVTLKTPANAGAKNFSPKGVGCLHNSCSRKAVAVCGLYSFFEERNKEGYVLSFGANERTKENIHPSQALP